MSDSVGNDTLTTQHNGRAGPAGWFPLSYSGCLAGVLGVRGKPHFRWIDGVKDACKDRKMGLATARRRCRTQSEWRGVTEEIL